LACILLFKDRMSTFIVSSCIMYFVHLIPRSLWKFLLNDCESRW